MNLRMILSLLLMAVCVALGPRVVFAHAALISAEPPDRAVLRQAPDRFVLHFTEPVSPIVLRLVGPNGEATDLKPFELQHQSVEMLPPAGLSRGTYALSWRVVSADSHPIGGSVIFSIGSPISDQQAGAPQASRAVQIGLWSARLLIYIGVFVGVGGAFFAAWVAGRSKLWGSARRGIVISTWIGVLATILSVGLQGLDTLAVPLLGLRQGAAWLQGLKTSFGLTAIPAILALSCGLLSLIVRNRWQAQALSGAALVGIGFAFAASGHASTAEPQWLARTSIFIHVTGLAFWIGALVPLLTMLRSTDPQGVITMNRFSVIILPVVITLIITGVVLAAIQVRSVQALWSTSYGTVLLLKLLVAGGLLVLAAINRLVFTPALARNDVPRRERFAQSIAAESVLVLLILGLVAGWRFTPPPRIGAARPGNAPSSAPEAVAAHIHTNKVMAQVTLSPGQAGRTTMTIRLVTASGAPLNPKEVAVALSNSSSGIEPFERNAVQVNQGTWRVDDWVLPVPGQWQVQIDALVSDFDKVTLEGVIEFRR